MEKEYNWKIKINSNKVPVMKHGRVVIGVQIKTKINNEKNKTFL